ncbi:hypothetical protein [Aquimarina sediminis]|uniref:hypothetical protein n=1 Tax=Aquimarina sediminis TaxID=2070536 RepID=UPI000CA061DB|nr:hypothetical protein [Aquimarina sediminis]
MKPTTVFVFLLTSFISFCQSRKEVLSDIRNKFELIKELVDANTLRQHHTDYSCHQTLGEGSLTFYYNGNELKHVIHTYSQGHVKYKDEYYVWDDQLIFQYATHDIWYKDYERTRSGKRKLVNVTLTLEERFYFKDRNAIKCQFKDYKNRSNSPKKIKTNHVRNINIDCDQSQNALDKFDLLLKFQKMKIEDACNLPKGITKTGALDMIYGNLGHN